MPILAIYLIYPNIIPCNIITNANFYFKTNYGKIKLVGAV